MPLQPNEVKTEHIATGAVTTPKIADEAVTSAKLKDGAVKTEKLATGAVTTSKLADNAVTGSKIRDSVIRSEKLAAGAITTAKIGEAQVTSSRLQNKSVTTEKLANSSVTTEKIANASVTPAKLSFTPSAIARPITPPVSTPEIADGAVTTPKMADSAVTETKLATDAVTTPKIKDGSVTPEKLSFVPGGGVGKFESALLHIQDRKEYGVQGGDFVANVLRTRDLNTVLTNEIAGASLNNNQITLPAGKYYIEASAPAFKVHGHKATLWDPVNLVYFVEGTSECSVSNDIYAQTRSFVSGRFELIAPRVLELRHQCQQTEMADGCGVPASAFGNEIYADLKIWKID